MQEATPQVSAAADDDDARLESLGYRPQLNRVLGLFANFSVAFTYLSPVVGIYSLFAVGLGYAGPGYMWTTLVPVLGMLLVALVFGELASHYPIAGALYQYSKYNVGRRYGWFVGWFYGIALLVTVASVDTGVVGYFTALMQNWFGWTINPSSHLNILIITLVLVAIQTTLNITGAKVMGRVAQFGVYVEILGTLGVAIVLAIHGFHHGFSYLFTSQGVQNVKSNPLGFNFHGSYGGALLVAVLVPVYIFYGFESAGDVSEETKDAGRQVPKAMRYAMIWGGIASLIVTAALILAIPTKGGIAAVATGGVPVIFARRRGWVPAGKFQLGKWAWPVYIVGALYLLAMLINIVAPTGLSSPRAFMNLDWITLVIMIIVAIVGVVFFLLAHSGKSLDDHLRDDAEKPAAVKYK